MTLFRKTCLAWTLRPKQMLRTPASCQTLTNFSSFVTNPALPRGNQLTTQQSILSAYQRNSLFCFQQSLPRTNLPSCFNVQTSVKRHSSSQSHEEAQKETGLGYLVYQGRVGNMFRALKIFSLTTSAIGLAMQPYLAYTYQDMPLAAAVPLFAAVNLFVFVNPLLIHFVAKKYVMELYFEPETKSFTAVMLTFLARKVKFTFTAEDVKVPDVPGMFSMLTAKDRPLFVMESDFSSMEVYKHLMGFDKPLDLTFDKKEE